jgi:hypothetical protein
MEKVFTPMLTVSFAVDIEIEYNPFEGLTSQDLAIRLQDEIHDLIMEANPKIKGVFTSITAIEGPSND